MEISYRREMKHNYLVVDPDREKEAGYEAQMLAGNEIQGLLQMRIKYQEGQPFYYYDITSRQPLSRLIETRFITRDEICMILMQLHSALTGMEGFLLGEGGIMLEPEYIYVEPGLFQVGICLIPDGKGDFQESLSRFLQYILKRVNHKDRECVVLAYGLYQESLKENFSMDDLLRLTVEERNKGKDTGAAGNAEALELPEKDGIYGNSHGCESPARQGEHVGRTPLPGKTDIALPWGRNSIQPPPGKTGTAPPQALEHEIPRLPLKKQLILWLSAVLLLPAFLWGLKGTGGVLELKYVLLGIDGGLLGLIILMDIMMLKFPGFLLGRVPAYEEERGDNPWKILYEDEDKDEMPADASDSRNPSSPPPVRDSSFRARTTITPEPDLKSEENVQTVLLTGVPMDEAVHCLTPIRSSGEEIPIPYVPFVIGKHKELADYVLSRDTVSRFHLRIDKEGDHYQITDLNSTNGTKVNDRLLEANETIVIMPGDEVYLADFGYFFRRK